MPGVGEALAGGTVTAGHVDALAKAVRQLDDEGKERLAGHEESLVEAAASLTPEQFDRECQDLARNLSGDDGLSRQERMRRERNVRRWVDKHTGMCKTLLSLDPLADAMAWTAINAAMASRPQRPTSTMMTAPGTSCRPTSSSTCSPEPGRPVTSGCRRCRC